jgi:hypothetical protein
MTTWARVRPLCRGDSERPRQCFWTRNSGLLRAAGPEFSTAGLAGHR